VAQGISTLPWQWTDALNPNGEEMADSVPGNLLSLPREIPMHIYHIPTNSYYFSMIFCNLTRSLEIYFTKFG
jgi:hypothetical protein